MSEAKEKFAEILKAQEAELVHRIEAVRVSGKGELIGAEFELAIRDKINSVLPSTIRVTSGFVMLPWGGLSSHFDGILIDARYPFLCRAGAVDIVPIHAVIGAFELKVSLNSKELKNAIKKERELSDLYSKFIKYLKNKKTEKMYEAVDAVMDDISELANMTREIKRLRKSRTSFAAPVFGILAHSSNFSVSQIAKRLYFMRSDSHLVILRPKEEKYNVRPDPRVKIVRIGKDGPDYHIWREYSNRNRPQIMVRGTSYGYGFFLSQSLIQEAMAVLSDRSYNISEVASHLDGYIEKLIDIGDDL